MNTLTLSIMATALVTACACVLPGVFMVLRGVALMSDAISHAILLGIVLMFFCVHNLNSPFLIIGAACAGFFTVIATEFLIQTACLKKDAAIGLVFPLFFSIAIILINIYARDIHLDMDMVLLGELAFIPFNRFILHGIDFGPAALWVMSIITICNALFVIFFYKELQLSIFDPMQATIVGCMPNVLYYSLMGLVSITAVGAFDVVGSIVVVALMITPAATAFMITYTLKMMLMASLAIGIMSALLGYMIAWLCDVSIAGSIAMMSGFIYMLVCLMAPHTGIYAQWMRARGTRKYLFIDIMCLYIAKNGPLKEIFLNQLASDLGWRLSFVKRLLAHGAQHDMLIYTDSYVDLTQYGRERVHRLQQGAI